jgi:hypothetical protein
MSKVLCFGELLLRLSPQLGGVWIRHNNMPVFVGGAELNAATALANWNVPVSYFTALPDHYLSHEIIASIQEKKAISQRSLIIIFHMRSLHPSRKKILRPTRSFIPATVSGPTICLRGLILKMQVLFTTGPIPLSGN